MKKLTFRAIGLSFVFTNIIYTYKVYASDIPEKVEEVNYFLKFINTSLWIWAFRIVCIAVTLGILISFLYYKDKKINN